MSKPTAFPLDESRLPFEIPRDEPYREKIARLGQMITDRIPAKKGILTKDDPEYWGLASIVTDEMADVALKMKVRKPMTLPELVKVWSPEGISKSPAIFDPLKLPPPRKAVHPADVRARQRRVLQYEQTADRRPPRGDSLL